MSFKVGEVVIGRTKDGALVAGPVVSVNEKAGLVIVGPLHQNSNTAVLASCVSEASVGQPPVAKPAAVKAK